MSLRVPENGGRVRRTDTGEEATFINRTTSGAHEVLLDTGPKQSALWGPEVPVVILPHVRGRCTRCGEDGHHAFYCPVTA